RCRDADARRTSRLAIRVDRVAARDPAARAAAGGGAAESGLARRPAVARGARGTARARPAPDFEQHRARARRGCRRYAGRRSLCADESAAHAVGSAEPRALSRRAVRALLSQRLSREPSLVPRRRHGRARRRSRARPRTRAAAARFGRRSARRADRCKRCVTGRPSRLLGGGGGMNAGGKGHATNARGVGPATSVDVLIPTYRRPTALAVTMTSLCAQTHVPFRVIVADQTEGGAAIRTAEAAAVARVLASRGCE